LTFHDDICLSFSEGTSLIEKPFGKNYVLKMLKCFVPAHLMRMPIPMPKGVTREKVIKYIRKSQPCTEYNKEKLDRRGGLTVIEYTKK
jgi:hypothetical protein